MKPPGVPMHAKEGPDGGDERLMVRVVSWVVFPLAVVLTLGSTYLSTLNRGPDVPGAAVVVVDTLLGLVGLGFIALGLLVVHRRPRNPVGWIIAGAGLTAGVSDFAERYAVYALYT